MKAPFQERKTVIRGALDLLSGCYPGFLFGGDIGDILPVFHFHDVTSDYLDPYLAYLSSNGYQTVTSQELTAYIKSGTHPGPKSVVLTFDDAWASLTTVVGPLLKKHNMRAITYAVPGRIEGDDSENPLFASWKDLKALQEAGLVDVQAHTYSHAKVFCSSEVSGFVHPGMDLSLLSRPALSLGENPLFLSEAMLGCPVYFSRSRMSDAVRFIPEHGIQDKCLEYVRANGGDKYFDRKDWESGLRAIIGSNTGTNESEEERENEIRMELLLAKSVLEERMNKSISQICFPWGVCGELAEKLARDAGYETSVADVLFGKRYVKPGSNAYRIMRLKHQYIYCLPGEGRRNVFKLRG